jgi:hypothetical protein
MEYDLPEVHRGRKVRCKSCKNPFALGDDQPLTVAAPVAPAAAPAAPAAKPAPPRIPAPTPPPEPKPALPKIPAPPPPAAPAAKPAAPGTETRQRTPSQGVGVPKRDHKSQRELASSMSKKLSKLQDAALETAAPAKATTSGAAQLGARNKGNFKVVKAEGPDTRIQRGIIVGAVVLVLLLVLVPIWIATGVGDAGEVLKRFGNPPGASVLEFPLRHRLHQEECWGTLIAERSLIIPLDAGQATRGSVRSFAGRALANTLGADLATCRYLPVSGLWVPIEVSQLQPAVMQAGAEEAAKLLKAAGAQFHDHDSLLAKLAELGLDQEQQSVVLRMLLSCHDDGRPSDAARNLLTGQWPETWHVQSFHREGGRVLRIGEQGYEVAEGVAYQGVAVRCDGPGWPQRWFILDCAVE